MSQTPPADAVETLPHGLTRTWLHNRQVVVITAEGTMERENVDFWTQTVIETYQTWPDNQPLLVLHDVSHKNQGVTPYILRRAEDTIMVLSHKDDMHGRIAVLVANNFIARAIMGLISRIQRKTSRQIELKIFVERHVALAWIQDMLPSPQNQS